MKKPLFQKIPLATGESFVARTFRTPDFEVGWHQHPEVELILFTEGSGLSFIGDHVGHWQTGDCYLLGPGLPHSFQKSSPEMIASAVVVQFLPDFWGRDFLELPENLALKRLLELSASGLSVTAKQESPLAAMIRLLEHSAGFARILILGNCLEAIQSEEAYTNVSASSEQFRVNRKSTALNKVFDFTIRNFSSPVTLKAVSDLACMSIPAFCNWFKKSTKKTYIDFLNEIRIGQACRLLLDSKDPISQVAWSCGFNTGANFHKQFLKVKGISPLQYRKQFLSSMDKVQKNIHMVDS